MFVKPQFISMSTKSFTSVCRAPDIKLVIDLIDDLVNNLSLHLNLRYKTGEQIIHGVWCFDKQPIKNPAEAGFNQA